MWIKREILVLFIFLYTFLSLSSQQLSGLLCCSCASFFVVVVFEMMYLKYLLSSFSPYLSSSHHIRKLNEHKKRIQEVCFIWKNNNKRDVCLNTRTQHTLQPHCLPTFRRQASAIYTFSFVLYRIYGLAQCKSMRFMNLITFLIQSLL